MQGWIKQDIGPKGESCEFHTITFAGVNFSLLPDSNGEGGATSTIKVSTFVSKEFYDANRGNAELAVKHRFYAVSLPDVAQMVRAPDGVKSVEQKSYELIIAQDPWFSDATIVD